jgi:hypothetical protein
MNYLQRRQTNSNLMNETLIIPNFNTVAGRLQPIEILKINFICKPAHQHPSNIHGSYKIN